MKKECFSFLFHAFLRPYKQENAHNRKDQRSIQTKILSLVLINHIYRSEKAEQLLQFETTFYRAGLIDLIELDVVVFCWFCCTHYWDILLIFLKSHTEKNPFVVKRTKQKINVLVGWSLQHAQMSRGPVSFGSPQLPTSSYCFMLLLSAQDWFSFQWSYNT